MKIMRRTRDAKTEQVGTVEWKDNRAVFDVPEQYHDLLAKLEYEGVTYTPADPEYLIILPLVLRGDRLWATEN